MAPSRTTNEHYVYNSRAQFPYTKRAGRSDSVKKACSVCSSKTASLPRGTRYARGQHRLRSSRHDRYGRRSERLNNLTRKFAAHRQCVAPTQQHVTTSDRCRSNRPDRRKRPITGRRLNAASYADQPAETRQPNGDQSRAA